MKNYTEWTSIDTFALFLVLGVVVVMSSDWLVK